MSGVAPPYVVIFSVSFSFSLHTITFWSFFSDLFRLRGRQSHFLRHDPTDRNEAKIYDETWIGDELLRAMSAFSPEGYDGNSFWLRGRSEDWEVILPSNSDRVCSQHRENKFPMYKVVFKDMGFRLPFSNLRRSVL